MCCPGRRLRFMISNSWLGSKTARDSGLDRDVSIPHFIFAHHQDMLEVENRLVFQNSRDYACLSASWRCGTRCGSSILRGLLEATHHTISMILPYLRPQGTAGCSFEFEPISCARQLRQNINQRYATERLVMALQHTSSAVQSAQSPRATSPKSCAGKLSQPI
jgi:hypothetical protein